MTRAAWQIALAAGVLLAASAASAAGTLLRYALEPGQRWQATQTVSREMQLGEIREQDHGVARFSYEVKPSPLEGYVALEATMLSQETRDGPSPFDFSVIRYRALMDARGTLRGVHFELGDAEPPELPGVEKDPVAFRQMLRSIAAAWLDSVFWFPQLPEQPLAIGESFSLEESKDVPGVEPGVSMRMVSTRTFRLRAVEEGIARLDIAVDSRVETATAQSAMDASREAEGEADFDLGLGMWRRHVMRAEHHASFHGAPGVADGESKASTLTSIAMEPLPPASQPGAPVPGS